jgi:hypothetical protein
MGPEARHVHGVEGMLMSEPVFVHGPRPQYRGTVPAVGGPGLASTDAGRGAEVLALQQLAGNRAVSTLLSGPASDRAAIQRQGPANPEGSPGNPIDLDAWAAANPEGSPGNPIDLDAWAAANPQGASQAAPVSAPQSAPGTVTRTPTPLTLKAVWKSIQRTGSQYPRELQLIFLAWARCESGDAAAGGSSALNFNMMNAEGNMGEAPPARVAAPTSGLTDPESARKRYDPRLNGPLSDWHPESKVPMSYYYYDPATKEKWDARTIDGQLATLPQRKSQLIAVVYNNLRRPAFPDVDSGVSYALRWFDRTAKQALGASAARKALAEKALAGDLDSALMLIEGNGRDPHWNGSGSAYRSLLKANYAPVVTMADSGALDDKS